MDKTTVVKNIIESLEKSQWYSPDYMRTRQLTRLEQIITHTFNTVPFYREYLEHSNYQPSQPLTQEFLSSLPILSRQQLQSGQDTTLKSTALQADDFTYPIVTSGSTGVAVRLMGTFDTTCYWQALSMREHLWHQRDFSKTLAAIRWAKRNEALPPLGETNKHWGSVTEGIINTGAGFFLNIASSTQSQLKWLQMINPHYLLSYPSQLKIVLQEIIDQKILLQNLLEIRSLGETVDPELISMSKNYPVKFTDIYSSEEFGIIAIQCPEYHNYHVQSENVIIEILNDDDKPSALGEEGRIILTSLHNFATPLLRYDIGDYAQLDTACPCGRDALPTIKKICGRKRNRIIFPNGESRFPYLGEREEYRHITKAVKKFQMIQHDLKKIECKLVVDNPLTPDQKNRYSKLIKKNLGYPFDIELTFHSDIPRQPNGKFEEFVSLTPFDSKLNSI